MIEHPFSEDNIFATTKVTYAEMIATMTRAYQGRRINDEELETMITMFQEQWRKVDVVEVNRELIELAGQMARTHALRGCDAFQLASALDTQTTLLISSDNDLNDAARNNGLNVWNPIEKDFLVKPID